jgi:hypothetical protein
MSWDKSFADDLDVYGGEIVEKEAVEVDLSWS